MYTGLRAAAVPIYAGAPQILEHVPPPSSVILADEYDGADALGRHLKELLAQPDAYARHLQWNLSAFATYETVRQCPWQCRVCELVASRARTF